ncbi:universal stress protein [Thermophagus sp. OGC60D27]|uniref:universal stress protein n=1 Tax=Thermophagus sp. OGC60D27 TaxID=3458415 RepID=UPI004037CF20
MINILVPVTFTDYSVNALTYALTLALRFPSKVTILHSFSEYVDIEEDALPEMPNSEESIQRREKEARDRLNRLCQAAVKKVSNIQSQKIDLQSRFEFGYPEEVIVDVCKELNSDVVIMGTKSKGETIKELLGSITSDVMKSAEAPVLAVPANSAVDLEKLSKVLFITEFNEKDYLSIHKLVRLITPFNSVIHGIRFVHNKPDNEDLLKLEHFKDYCKATYPRQKMIFNYEISKQFIPDLEKYVVNNGIDLIAMTKRKRNMIAQLFSPEITRKILFHTDIPLLVFHP